MSARLAPKTLPQGSHSLRELASYFCYLPSNRAARLPSSSTIKPAITDHHLVDFNLIFQDRWHVDREEGHQGHREELKRWPLKKYRYRCVIENWFFVSNYLFCDNLKLILPTNLYVIEILQKLGTRFARAQVGPWLTTERMIFRKQLSKSRVSFPWTFASFQPRYPTWW